MQRLKLLALTAGALAIFAVAAPTAGAAVGGPVILGGDDQTDHGHIDEAGDSQLGWLYIEKAVANIKARVGRANDGSIAVFGSQDPGPLVPPTGGDAGQAIKNAAQKNGMTVQYFDTADEINAGFAAITAGTITPAIIHIAGDGASNDIDSCRDDEPTNQTDGEAITANALVINAFVNSGGGLLSHSACYDWVTALIPGLTAVDSGGDFMELTPEGQAAFPGLTNEMISSGPWHNHFEGDFGGLNVLATAPGAQFFTAAASAQQAPPTVAVIIGGGQVSFTEKPTDLAITKVDSSDPITAGSDLTYTLTVTNNGPNPATGVTVTDTLPAGLSAKSSTASQGSCSGTTTVTCSLGDLASGASATVTIVVKTSAAGTITNTATVSGNQPDPNDANNSATQETTVAAVPAAQRQLDGRAPRIALGGIRATGCTSRSFTAQVRVRDASRLRSVRVFINGRRVQTSTRKRFGVRVSVGALRAGRRNTIRVVAVDARGNRSAVSRSFRRCALPAVDPVFTG